MRIDTLFCWTCADASGFRDHILNWTPIVESAEAAKFEPDEMEELDVEL